MSDPPSDKPQSGLFRSIELSDTLGFDDVSTVSLTPTRVLVVGDDQRVLDAIVTMTGSAEGLRVEAHHVDHPAMLGELVRSERTDAVVAAASGAELSGPAVLAAVQAEEPSLPVIWVSELTGEEAAVAALHQGFADFLHRARLERLPEAIRQAGQRRQRSTERSNLLQEARTLEQEVHSLFEAAPVAVFLLHIRSALQWLDALCADRGELDLAPYVASHPGVARAILEIVSLERANTTAASTLCRPDRSSLFGTAWEVFDDELRDVVLDVVLDAFEERTAFEAETQVGNRLLLMSCRLRDARTSGRVALFGVDVTERRALARQQAEAVRLEAAARAAGGIAHDFNNLLSVVLTNLSMLHSAGPGALDHPDGAQDLEDALGAVGRASALAKKLLHLGRPSEGDPGPTNWDGLLDNLGELLRRLVREDVELVLQASGDACFVGLDADRSEHILVNLVLNARDAGASQVRVEIGPSVKDARGHHQTMTVIDDGCGMTDSVQRRMFQPFFTTKGERGHGLGLATLYSIVKGAGGWIEVQSAPGQGTTLSVSLPVVEHEAEPEPPPTVTWSGPLPPVEVPAASGPAVLLVDDDEHVLRSLRRLLEGAGYRVETADTVDRALHRATDIGEDLAAIVSDVVMPDGGGRRLGAALRDLGIAAPLVFISGHRESSTPGGGLEDAVAVLQKPFRGEELLGALRLHAPFVVPQA